MPNLLQKLSLRYVNIVQALYYGGKMSCAAVSNDIGLSIPSTQKLLGELLDKRLICENGIGLSSGGRKPVTYSLISDTMYILSVAMDQFATRIVITNLHNDFVTPVNEFELNLYGNTNAAGQLAALVNKVLIASGLDTSKVVAAGIAMPGFINEADGVNYSYLPAPNGESLEVFLAEKLNLPVFIFNDSNAVALAELKFGLGAAYKEMMVINIGWGIGLGMIINGKMYNGHSGFAGEFSHMPLVKNGKLCNCGKHGCLETVASLISIEEKAIAVIKAKTQATSLSRQAQAPTINNIIDEALKGDQFCIRLLSDAGYNIGQGLAILLHIMNPEVIVLSGKGAIAGKLWLAPIQQAVNEHSIPRLASVTQILLSALGNNAELIGAAAFVIENLDKVVLKDKQPVN
jgi:predicted NBD/HSP70 family sugar kinase